MHPLTIYETAIREHERATAQRLRTHEQALQRRIAVVPLPRAALRSPLRTQRAAAAGTTAS